MNTRRQSLKKKQDVALINKFLKRNPGVNISKPSVNVSVMSPNSIVRKKFLLRNPSVKLKEPQIRLKRLPSVLDSLDKLKNHMEREKKLQRNVELKKIYYDPSHPAGYSSSMNLYKHVKKILPHITVADVETWLSKQRSHFLNKQVRKFARRPVLVRGVQHQYQADLMDFKPLKNYNNRQRYLLTVIDCFSRKACAIPLTSKKGKSVLRGLRKAFHKMGFPKKLQTDQGKEFWNEHVTSYLRKKNIAHFFTRQELKAQMVERFNRTLRDKIAKHIFATDSFSFVKVVPDLVEGYNNKTHSSLKRFSPNQVNRGNEKTVRRILYGSYFQKNKKAHRYDIGDKVRPIIKRPYHRKMQKQFEEEIYIITDTIESHPPTYHIKKASNNTAVEGAFYEKQLQLVR